MPQKSNLSKTSADLAKLLSIGEGVAPDSGPDSGTDPDPRLAGLARIAAQMGEGAPSRDAPPREVMARLGDSWSALILLVLSTGTFRHATLKRVIAALSSEGDISQRMLTLRLRALERDGFVTRTLHPTVPPRVDYALTPMGAELTQQFGRLLAWIEAHAPAIHAARARAKLDTAD